MKKRYITGILFFLYVILLLYLAGQFELHDEHLSSQGFATGFGEGLALLFRYIFVSLLSSSAFLMITFLIHKKHLSLMLFVAPMLNVPVAVIISFILNFVVCITGLEVAISIYQEIFFIAAISTMCTTLWLFGGMFSSQVDASDIHQHS